MKVFKDKEICIVFLVFGFAISLAIWSIVGQWFPKSPQDVAEERGITIGFLGATNQDGSFVIVFDNENIGKKRLLVYPTYAKEGIDFIESDRDYVILTFDPKGTKGCEKLTDNELLRDYLQRIEVHYR